MAEEDNLVIRMLREIRTDTTDLRSRMVRVERRLEEVQEAIGMALGMAAQARVSSETQGGHMDEIRDEIAALKRRVAELEARQ